VGKTVRHLYGCALACIVLYYSYVCLHCYSILKLCPDHVAHGERSTWASVTLQAAVRKSSCME